MSDVLIFHYVRKDAVLRAIVDNEPSTALCGETDWYNRDGGIPSGDGSKGQQVVCRQCLDIYNGLRPTREAIEQASPVHQDA